MKSEKQRTNSQARIWVTFFALGSSILMVCATLAACGGAPSRERRAEAEIRPSSPAPRPVRIVSLAPSLTEIIYALGAEDRLAGVTPYCRYPPEAAEKPKVGALVNMNYERLLELEPDLVLLLPGHARVSGELDRLGIPSLTVRSDSVADILDGIRTLGHSLDLRAEADRLIQSIELQMREIREERSSHESGRAAPPRVLFVIGRNPGTLQQIYVCGSGSFLDEMIEIAGAVNVLSKTASPWPVISKESIIELDPDVILDGSIRKGDAPIDQDVHMKAWDRLGMLSAVKSGRVIAVEDEHLMIPGPEIVSGARLLAELIFRGE